MSLARVIEILEVVNEFYQDGGVHLSADALLLEDDTNVRDAIAEALSECLAVERSAEVRVSEVPKTVPKSERRHYGRNYLGNWVGLVGKNLIRNFGPGEEGREAAIQWANSTDTP